MSDKSDAGRMRTTDTSNKVRLPAEETDTAGGMPVEELIRITRETIGRIRNEDRKRLQAEAAERSTTIQSGMPHLLQQFMIGKIDLDEELARRFPSPPLLSGASFDPPPGKRARRGYAQFKSQDEVATMILDVQGIDGTFEASYVYGGMISARFSFSAIPDASREKFLNQVRRLNGTATLWTPKRWERDYMIVSKQDGFARIYIFGAEHFSAGARLTPDVFSQMIQWLTGFWVGDTQTAPPEDSNAW